MSAGCEGGREGGKAYLEGLLVARVRGVELVDGEALQTGDEGGGGALPDAEGRREGGREGGKECELDRMRGKEREGRREGGTYPGGPESNAALAPGFSFPLPGGSFFVLCLWKASHCCSQCVSLVASAPPPIKSLIPCGAYFDVHISELDEEEEEEEDQGGREDEEEAAAAAAAAAAEEEEEEEGAPEGFPGMYLGGVGLEGGAEEEEEEGGREDEDEGVPDFSIMS